MFAYSIESKSQRPQLLIQTAYRELGEFRISSSRLAPGYEGDCTRRYVLKLLVTTTSSDTPRYHIDILNWFSPTFCSPKVVGRGRANNTMYDNCITGADPRRACQLMHFGYQNLLLAADGCVYVLINKAAIVPGKWRGSPCLPSAGAPGHFTVSDMRAFYLQPGPQ